MLENFGTVVDGWRRQTRNGGRGGRRRDESKMMSTRIVPREHVVSVALCMLVYMGVLAGMAGQVRAAMYVVDQAAPGAADTNAGTDENTLKGKL